MLSGGVLVLYVAALLQCALVTERVIYHTLSVVIHGKRPPLKQLTDKGVLAAFAATIAECVAVAIGILLTLCNVLFRNLALVMAVVILGAGLLVLGGSGNTVFALAVNLYNSGVGVLIDAAIIKPLQLGYIVFTPFIVL